LTGDPAGGECSGECLRGVAAADRDTGRFDRAAVESAPRHRIGAAPLHPFLGKGGLAAGKECELGRQMGAVVGNKAFEPAVMVAVAVAEDQPGQAAGVEVEQREVADQHLGGKAEIEPILRSAEGTDRFEVERQPPLADEGRPLVPRDPAQVLDPDHRVGGVGDEQIVRRIDNHPNREAVDERCRKRLGRGRCGHWRSPL
jgi:hypothetical protein